MEKKEREQLKERLLKMVVNEPRPESMPPITMAEVMVNSMSKPNPEPLLDFVEQELSKAREEVLKRVLKKGKIINKRDGDAMCNLGDSTMTAIYQELSKLKDNK